MSYILNGQVVEETTEEIYAAKIAAQTEAQSGTVTLTYQDALSVLPVTLPDGTVSTLGESVGEVTAPFALLSKWVLTYDNGLVYKQVDDPTGIGSKDNPFIGDDIPETQWPLKDGAYYRKGDTLYKYTATLTGGKFTTVLT